PALLICVHRLSPACAAIEANGRFCVNLLRADQADISDTFAGRRKTENGDKFGCARWRRLATGAPALDDALVTFDCTLMRQLEWGTHAIFIADVVDVEVAEAGQPLVYANRGYAISLPALAAAATH
ncbi:MAG: flavin reductase family protein, partial [Dongiaceae bacterium]